MCWETSRVMVNPYRVDKALFGFNLPLLKGALRANAVSLGKAIVAGLVFFRKWLERKRCMLSIHTM